MSARTWCFTLNNYTEAEIEMLRVLPCRYMVCGLEVGDEGTPHVQGYIEMSRVMRLAGMRKLIERAHFEVRRGTRDQARGYCLKDGNAFETGVWAAGGQGARNDLRGMMDAIRENQPVIEVMEAFPNVYARNMRFAEKYREVVEKEDTREFRQLDVQVLWGDAGTGKTRQVFEEYPDAFTVNCDEAFPFEGYDGEQAIVLDDFYGDIKYHQLLRILDGHQYRVNVKGSHRYARWTKVFITSNKRPENWYQMGMTPALQRRLTNVTEFIRNEEPGNTEPAQN